MPFLPNVHLLKQNQAEWNNKISQQSLVSDQSSLPTRVGFYDIHPTLYVVSP